MHKQMKLIYCIHSIYNPGGMERVLLNKVAYLKERYGWDITIVTTNQSGRPPFYPFPEGVKIVDLGVNYSASAQKGADRVFEARAGGCCCVALPFGVVFYP